MKNNWPETVDELVEECQRLISEYDLYTLGERGEPFSGETEPRVDGTEYLAGEHQYGISMIPAQWVTHVLKVATLGGGECEMVRVSNTQDARKCSACGRITCFDYPLDRNELNYCPKCGARVRKAVGR